MQPGVPGQLLSEVAPLLAVLEQPNTAAGQVVVTRAGDPEVLPSRLVSSPAEGRTSTPGGGPQVAY